MSKLTIGPLNGYEQQLPRPLSQMHIRAPENELLLLFYVELIQSVPSYFVTLGLHIYALGTPIAPFVAYTCLMLAHDIIVVDHLGNAILWPQKPSQDNVILIPL
jgi:hypothetical protein